jgi:hypothetical protein
MICCAVQAVQQTEANWNGETVELALNLMLSDRYEVLRAPMTTARAEKLLDQLQKALDEAK